MNVFNKLVKEELQTIDDEIEKHLESMKDLLQEGILDTEPEELAQKQKIHFNYNLKDRRYDYTQLNKQKLETKKGTENKKVMRELDKQSLLWSQHKPDLMDFFNRDFLGLRIENEMTRRGARERLAEFEGKCW